MKKSIGMALIGLLLVLGGSGQAAVAQSVPHDLGKETSLTIYGKIKEINGNEVLLALAELGETARPAGANLSDGEIRGDSESEGEDQPGGVPRNGGQFGAAQAKGGNPPGSASLSEGQPGTAEAAALAATGGNRQPVNGQPSTARGTSRAAESPTVRLTGEEAAFLIPVTAVVTTGQGESGRAIRFTQLAARNVVCLRLNEKGGIIAVEVLQ